MKIIGLSQDDKNALKVPLENVPPGQVTIKDIRTIDRICRAIEESPDGEIEMETADMDYLKGKWREFTSWNPSNPQVRTRVIALSDKLGLQ